MHCCVLVGALRSADSNHSAESCCAPEEPEAVNGLTGLPGLLPGVAANDGKFLDRDLTDQM